MEKPMCQVKWLVQIPLVAKKQNKIFKNHSSPAGDICLPVFAAYDLNRSY